MASRESRVGIGLQDDAYFLSSDEPIFLDKQGIFFSWGKPTPKRKATEPAAITPAGFNDFGEI